MSNVFDQVANSYDEHFTLSEIGRLQREQVWQYLQETLSPDQALNILEISCGTGEDAVFLAKKGHQITATDSAGEMIRVTQQKAAKHQLEQYIKPIHVAAQKLDQILDSDLKYDFIFSNFGGLNCLSSKELRALSKVLHQRLLHQSQSRFVAVIMPSFCAFESLYFLLKGRPKTAFRRSQKKGVLANVGDTQIHTYYYSPAHFAKLFSEHFTLKALRPIGITLPPSYLEPFFQKHPKLLPPLHRAELLVNRFGALSYISDHYLIDFEWKK